MQHPAVRSSRPLVFAHRGSTALAPENTFAAFDAALACGADGLELDVHLSRDGVVVVHHDRLLDRTTDAVGPLAARTAAELARVDAAARFGREGGYPFRGTGLGVPTLGDVLARYRDSRLIVEMKRNSRRLALAIVEEVRRAGALDRVCLGAFPAAALRVARRAEPSMATSASRAEVREALDRTQRGLPIVCDSYCAFQVPERSGPSAIVTPSFIDAAHRAGLVVHVWTVNDADEMRRLLDWGVDGLVTDRPDLAVVIVRERAERIGSQR